MRLCLLALLFAGMGCCTAVKRTGTEELLLSDSVDKAIAELDLSGMAGRSVFLDTEYIKAATPATGFVNTNYVISALREKMASSGIRIEPTKDAAEYILEARIGALGTDSMEVTYGLPSSSGLGTATSILAGNAMIPMMPEVSVAKRNGVIGVSKVVAYVYHKDTGTPVWQAKSAISRSSARDSWVFGLGPISTGSVYGGALVAGQRLLLPWRKNNRYRVVKDGVIADRREFVHPAVFEQQLAEQAAAAEGNAVRPVSQSKDAELPPPVPPSVP